MFSDTMYDFDRAGKMVINFTYTQVFATKFEWIHTYPLQYEWDKYPVLKKLFKEVGVTNNIGRDGAKSYMEQENERVCEK